MDIGSGNGYPSAALSNFAPHPFEIDGVSCASMEGFLQSLKFESIDMQRYVCTLVGKAAKKKGHKKNWYQKQELYWNGRTYKRDSEAYQNLLNRAYNRLYKNGGFYKALQATNGATLEHSIGKTKVPKRYLQDKNSALDLLICETEENFQNTMNQSNQHKWNLEYNATYLISKLER